MDQRCCEMCGIVGYIGYRRADEVLVSALKRLEYRGYDSWGIAVSDGEEISIFKRVGNISNADNYHIKTGSIGIGHTRWATHGKPDEINAHPHTDCKKELAVVHNGIISNFQQLKEKLTERGHIFKSETDTEVIAHLIEERYRGNIEEAVLNVIPDLKGSFAFAVLHKNERKLIACRYKSPLILGVGDKEIFFASDVPAILDYTNRVVYLEDGDVALVTDNGYRIVSEGKEIYREFEFVTWTMEDARKGGYEHYMLKEIHETPRVIEDTLTEYLEDDIEFDASFAAGISEIIFVACGTSYHAALAGKYIIEEFTGIPVRVEYASEFNYRPIPSGRALVIGITQSGETADTLEAMRRARANGLKVLTITNVLGSSATRIADYVLYIRAGPEISVAATKSFIAQLIILYLIALRLSTFPWVERKPLIDDLNNLPEKTQRILDSQEMIERISRDIASYDNIIYIGRGLGYPVALEGALKMKEISYIHAEGYPAGELKHGPFALLGPETPVVASVVWDNTYEVMLSNLKEVKARDSPVIALSDEKDEEIEKYVDHVIKVPSAHPTFSAILQSVVLQLLAYYTAKIRGCEIDRPRNLAKSVTVE